MIAMLGVAAIVCCAACTSGDVCNDLKTGQIVGASPFRQQIMQIVGVGVALGNGTNAIIARKYTWRYRKSICTSGWSFRKFS